MSAEEPATTGADLLVKALLDQGVDVVFGYPGGAVLPIYDALFKQNRLRHILVRHEQAAVHAAEGYARSTGKVGVVLVTSGPGATNAVTGLTDALMDSIPVVCLTGQVPTHLIGNDAFQEADTTGITRPCTKHNYLVKAVDDLARTIHEAFYVATQAGRGRWWSTCRRTSCRARRATCRRSRCSTAATARRSSPSRGNRGKRWSSWRTAKRPMIYTGGGVINSGPGAAKLLAQFVQLTGFPITSTLMGLGAFPARTRSFSACSACTAPTKRTSPCTAATSCSTSARASTTG